MRKSVLQKMLLTALFTALTAAGSIVRIGDFSLQNVFAIISGILLGPIWGPASQLLYVFMGLLGLPMFINGGGLLYVMEPTFGFLLGMILGSFVAGILTEKTQWNLSIIALLAFWSVYFIGMPWYHFYFRRLVAEGVLLSTLTRGIVYYIAYDIPKLVIVVPLGRKLLPVLRKDLYV